MSKNTRTRILLTAVAALLLVVMTVGGTLAWLADTTTAVTNTFDATGIDISLEESNTPWKMEMIPGTEKAKDPKVTVEDKTDVDIILFVQFTETVDEAYLTYTSTLTEANGWEYDDTNKVYYRLVSATDVAKDFACSEKDCTDKDVHWHMLAGDKVSIAGSVTKNGENAIPGGTMTWQAWAIQQTGFVTDGEVDNVTDAFTLAKANGVVSTGH